MCPAVAGAQQDDSAQMDPALEQSAAPVPPADTAPPVAAPAQGTSPSDQIFAQMEGASAPPVREKTNFVERPEDQEYIVEVASRDNFLISQGVTVYFDDTELLLPLHAMSEGLEFPIKVDSVSGTAGGWFVSPDRTFSLAPPYKEVTISGKKMPVIGTVENHIDDLYVDARNFELWFPLKLDFKFNELRINITPTEQLSFEAKAAREKRWERLQAQSRDGLGAEKDDYSDVIFLPYKKWSPPTFQISHALNANHTPTQNTKTAVTTVQATNDLLGHSARLNAAFNAGDLNVKGLNSVALTMSKEDYRANLLGPLKATSYSFGDIDVTNFALADGPSRGRGATVTNEPANFVRDINNFAVQGFGPVGWDVELYQDQQILDFIKIGSDGRYDFEDIDLREGFNLFRIVLYGPNGEKEERYERFYLGQNMVEKGKFIYNLSGLESTGPLFNVDDQKEDSGAASALGEYGLTDNMSVYGGVYSGKIGNSNFNALGSGVRLSSARFYTQLSGLTTDSGAWSGNVTTTGNLSESIMVGAGHTEHSGYEKGDRSFVRESYARFSQLFSFKFFQYGSYGFEARTSLSDSGVRTNTLTNRISGGFMGLNLSNELERRTTDTAGSVALIDGNLTARYRNGLGLWRGRLNYAIDDRDALQSGELGLQTDIGKDLFLNLGFNAQFTGVREKTLTASLDRQFQKFKLGVQTSASTENNYAIGATLTYNLVPTSQSGNYTMSGSTQALYNGTLELIPFVDENGDGAYTPGERTVPDVTFKNRLRGGKAVSDKNGVAALENISPSDINTVTLDVKTLPDIYMAPGREQLRIFGKSGFNGPIYYPISLLGEISGTLLTTHPVETAEEQSGVAGALGAIKLVLLDKNDKVVAETYSEYDGYFSFQSLPLGEYRLYIPASPLLDDWYTGARNGPPIALTAKNTEVSTLEVTLSPEAMTFKD